VVEPHVLDLDGVGVHPEVVADATLDVDGHVAQPDRPVSLVDQGLGHDAHGIGEVDHPGSRCPVAGGVLGDVDDEWHGAQGLGEPSGPGRLLAEAAEPHR